MNEREHELFEAELGRVKPAKPPENFMERLTAAQPTLRRERRLQPQAAFTGSWWQLIRWLAPAAAAAVVALVLIRLLPGPGAEPSGPAVASVKPAFNADNVEIDRQLVGAFDAIARMPDGEPVRFRCRKWMENVVLHDSKRGVEVEQRAPRLEVVPVSYETY